MISKAPVRSVNSRAVRRNSSADGINAAFSLDRFQADGAHAAIELPLQVVDVIEGDEPDAGQQRRKGMTILCLTGRGQRTKSAAVEGIFQSQNAPLRLVAIGVLRPRA